MSTISGPAATKAGDLIGLTKKAATGNFSNKDAKRLTKFIPGNNLFYLKLLNHHILEDAAASLEN
jgi:hypothetical protein